MLRLYLALFLSSRILLGVVSGFLDGNWTSELAIGDPDFSFEWDRDNIEPDCEESSEGSFAVTGPAPLCVVHVSGADDLQGRVNGSIDGTYRAFGCFDGFPIYYRIDSTSDGERVLWFSERFRDWNINKGLVAQPAEVMAFGGDGDAEPRPQLVMPSKWWFVRSTETRTVQDMFLKAQEFTIECLDADAESDL